jgi:hypothetical protein
VARITGPGVLAVEAVGAKGSASWLVVCKNKGENSHQTRLKSTIRIRRALMSMLA